MTGFCGRDVQGSRWEGSKVFPVDGLEGRALRNAEMPEPWCSEEEE